MGKTSIKRTLIYQMEWTLGVAQIDFLFALQLLLNKLICLMNGEVPLWGTRQNILEPKYSLSTVRGCKKWVNTAMNAAWIAWFTFARRELFVMHTFKTNSFALCNPNRKKKTQTNKCYYLDGIGLQFQVALVFFFFFFLEPFDRLTFWGERKKNVSTECQLISGCRCSTTGVA